MPMAVIASGSSSWSRVATHTSTPDAMSSTISSGKRAIMTLDDISSSGADKVLLAIRKGRENDNLATRGRARAHVCRVMQIAAHEPCFRPQPCSRPQPSRRAARALRSEAVYAAASVALAVVACNPAGAAEAGVAPLPASLSGTGLYVSGSTREVRPEHVSFAPQY